MIGDESIALIPGTHRKCDDCRDEASTFARCRCGKIISRCGQHGLAATKKCHG